MTTANTVATPTTPAMTVGNVTPCAELSSSSSSSASMIAEVGSSNKEPVPAVNPVTSSGVGVGVGDADGVAVGVAVADGVGVGVTVAVGVGDGV